MLIVTTSAAAAPGAVWLSGSSCDLARFVEVLAQRTDPDDYPWAESVLQNVPVYGARLRSHAATEARCEIQAELAHALLDGPGIVVVNRAFPDASVVDRATATFDGMIAEQRASGAVAGDHFAKSGANDRVWNALQKFASRDPEAFAEYYANDVIALISVAWLGPNYQLTSAVNVVNPGGAAQTPHLDYHLGFMPTELASRFPAHVHRLSPTLTLQGAVAHCDMPVESGPTLYLPYSQHFTAGYLAAQREEFREYFAVNHVQLPLSKGDAVFFNPALFHAAGENRTADVKRAANLLQISSALGRAMESVDRERVCAALYPTLRRWVAAGADEQAVANIVAATAEGYAFPTNLDRDQPVGALNPETQAELVHRALREGWPVAEFVEELHAHTSRHTAGRSEAVV